MKSTFEDMVEWLQGSKLGYSKMDKLALFAYIANAVIVLGFFLLIFGRGKTWEISLSNPNLFNWIPVQEILIKIDDILLRLPVLIDYVLFVKQDWEKEARDFALKLDCREGVMIDVGANIGHYTALLATKHPRAKVVSVEASAKNFELLKSNCRLNNISNVTQYNLAVSDKDNETIQYYSRDCLSTIEEKFLRDWHIPSKKVRTVTIQTITIDSLVKQEGIKDICLLKIDIEGAEILALKGADTTLKQKRIKNLIVEYHSKSNRTYIEKLLNELGYSYTDYQRPEIFDQEDHANGHIIAKLA